MLDGVSTRLHRDIAASATKTKPAADAGRALESAAAPSSTSRSAIYPVECDRVSSVSEAASYENIRVRAYTSLLLIDVACLIVGFLAANFVRFGQLLATPGLSYLAAFVPVYAVIAFSQRAYALEILRRPRTGIFRSLKALAVTAGALLVALFYAKTSAEMSRAVFGMGVVGSAMLLAGGRHWFGRRLGNRYNWSFQREAVLVDRVAFEPQGKGDVIYAEQAKLDPNQNDPQMAGRMGHLLAGYDRIILNASPSRRLQWVGYLKGLGIDVEVLTPELDYLGALALRRSNHGSAVLVAAGPLGLRDRIVKRAFDLALSSSMLLFFAPLLLAIAIAIKLTSPGPIFFQQARIGRFNRPFKVVKFRTMRADRCDKIGVHSVERDDDRLTTVGAFLRRTSLDELPQLFNVLRGEMSLVGPRPHAVGSTAENDLFWHIEARYWERGAVKPGITGLAQVRGFRGATSTRKDLTDRVRADLEYLADWSISKDFVIIMQTARVLVHPNAF